MPVCFPKARGHIFVRPVILRLWWCNSVLSGIRPQLDLIVSGSAEASVREEPHRDDCSGKSPPGYRQMLADAGYSHLSCVVHF